MPSMKPWAGQAPTLEEAAAYLTEDAAYLTGERETVTPPEVRHLATWTGSTGSLTVTEWTIDAAVVTFGYWSRYRGREVSYAATMFQLTQGGLAPDGWATFDVYKVSRALDEEGARQVADVILAGLPIHLAHGEM